MSNQQRVRVVTKVNTTYKKNPPIEQEEHIKDDSIISVLKKYGFLGVFVPAWLSIAAPITVGANWLHNKVNFIGDYFSSHIASFGGGTIPPVPHTPPNGGNNPTGFPESINGALGLYFFILAFFHLILLISKLPLKRSWLTHKRTAQSIKLSPIAFVLYAGIANSPLINTWLSSALLTTTLYSAALVFLLGTSYYIFWYIRCPEQIAISNGSEIYQYEDLFFTRSISRYFLTIIYSIFVINSAVIVFSLIPSVISNPPENWEWWCLFIPKCS